MSNEKNPLIAMLEQYEANNKPSANKSKVVSPMRKSKNSRKN
jgi:hypothetical protein